MKVEGLAARCRVYATGILRDINYTRWLVISLIIAGADVAIFFSGDDIHPVPVDCLFLLTGPVVAVKICLLDIVKLMVHRGFSIAGTGWKEGIVWGLADFPASFLCLIVIKIVSRIKLRLRQFGGAFAEWFVLWLSVSLLIAVTDVVYIFSGNDDSGIFGFLYFALAPVVLVKALLLGLFEDCFHTNLLGPEGIGGSSCGTLLWALGDLVVCFLYVAGIKLAVKGWRRIRRR